MKRAGIVNVESESVIIERRWKQVWGNRRRPADSL